MSRAVPRQIELPAEAPNGTQTALALHRSPAEERLEALQKEHERLLREIRKKKAAYETTEREARDVASVLEARKGPIREAFFATLKELRAIFTALLGPESRLNRRDKSRVRRLYAQLLPDLASEEGASPESGQSESPHSAPFGTRPPANVDTSEDAGYSATKPSPSASLLRSVFRRLAIALHPDKVQDPAQREALTAVMKEVTRAYETGDVARLVELETSWLCGTAARAGEADLERRTAEMLAANKELRRQLRSLTANLKELKRDTPGLEPPKRRGRTQSAQPHVEELIEQMDRELSHIQLLRDFARSFSLGDIDINEFLLGPALGFGRADDPFDALLEDMLDAMNDGHVPPPAGGRGGARGKRGRRRAP